MQQFYKGRTNNHLSWVMVDATDFATPESALSAAMKIKIYGKLRGATGTNFVSSGTGSLTNDIQHVGASVLGLYTIALVKADLSDASAAWYDQYVISLSATGAALQTLIVDGGIDQSALSAYQSRLSDLASYLVVMSGIQSDILSALILTQSMASDAASAAIQANSRVLLVLSLASDIDSALTSRFSDIHSFLSTTGVQLNPSTISDIRSAIAAGPAATVTASDISDIASAVWANTIGARVDSRLLLNQSRISDIASYLVVMSGVLSDVYSAASNINSLAIASPTASDIASAVNVELGSRLSDILSAAVQTNSRALVLVSLVSDVDSALTSRFSDLHSHISTTGVQLNASSLSDLRSAITAGATGLDASALSDIASAVVAAIGAQGVALDASSMSDLRSSILSLSAMLSDTHSAATAGASRALLLISSLSDLQSYVLSPGVQLNASTMSDLRSAITAGGAATVTASDISDMASAVADILASRLSDILSAATQTNSRALVIQSMVSDTQSKLSDVESNLLSFLLSPGVQLNPSTMSDLRSAVTAGITDASILSDILSAAVQANSRLLVNQSVASDIYSLLSDLHSDVTVMSGVVSDIRSGVNVTKVNNVTLVGDGNATPWGPV